MRCFSVFLLCGLCLAPAPTPAQAQWFRKPSKQPPQNPAAEHQGFAGYIRRLTADARAAAARGDLALARNLAERAHKVAITGKPMLTNAPDCTPEATAALVLQLKALPDPAAPSMADVQSAPTRMLNLDPLIDQNRQETSLPVPPSPAPAIDTPKQLSAVEARSARTYEEPALLESNQTMAATRSPRKRADRTAPKKEAAGFLALQTDWLSAETEPDAAIEQLAEEPVQAVTRKTRNQRTKPAIPRASISASDSSRKADFGTDDSDPPEVTTAIGSGVNRWQLDMEDDSSRFPQESVPHLSQDSTSRYEGAQSELPETSLGVWSTASSQERQGDSLHHVVSLSDFLAPYGHRPGVRPLEHPPRMIETDFRQPESTPIAAESSHLSQRSRMHQAASPGPAIEIHDGPAHEWTDTTASKRKNAPTKASAAAFDLIWSNWSPGRRASVLGMMLLIAGFALFGLSYRWS